MAWKGLHVSRPAYLHAERGSLIIKFRDDKEPTVFRVPLEDLGWVIVDSSQISFSSHLFSKCSEFGVLILGIDASHLPNWVSLPWSQFHRHGEVLELQLSASVPLKKRIWQKIIQCKITHQAAVLEQLNHVGANALMGMVAKVKSGDPDNIEARAAQKYFRALFKDPDFIRHQDDWINANLNYGYAIIRGVLARHLCASGFIPQLGIHHRSLSNAFNLADDLIEPFRPFVDFWVAQRFFERDKPSEFSVADRRGLVALLEAPTFFNGEEVTLFHAMTLCVQSLKSTLQLGQPSFLKFATFLT